MHRVARLDLHSLIAVSMALPPNSVKRGLKSREPDERERAQKELVEHICEQIDNGVRMVIQTERIGEPHHSRLGTWGIDEPVPATVPDHGKR